MKRKRKLKVGLLMDSFDVPYWAFKMIEKIKNCVSSKKDKNFKTIGGYEKYRSKLNCDKQFLIVSPPYGFIPLINLFAEHQ